MTYQSRRVPVDLGPIAQRVYLTLVAEADPSGLVRRSSWQTLMDFADTTKRRDVDRAVTVLAEHKIIRLIEAQPKTRSPYFEILGVYNHDIPLAQRFYNDNTARVRSLQNARSKRIYPAPTRALAPSYPTTVTIETIKELDVPPDKAGTLRQWRFSIRVAGCGIIRNCFARTYVGREPFIVGPATKIDDHWMDLVEFERAMIVHLRGLVLAAVDAHDREKPEPQGDSRALQMKA
jgi:hypothetical protein